MKEAKKSASVFETYFSTAGSWKTILTLKKNAIIYSHGDPSESIFYIQKGRVLLGAEFAVKPALCFHVMHGIGLPAIEAPKLAAT
jgi:hypothetical protein